jgi:hypothetical protein
VEHAPLGPLHAEPEELGEGRRHVAARDPPELEPAPDRRTGGEEERRVRLVGRELAVGAAVPGRAQRRLAVGVVHEAVAGGGLEEEVPGVRILLGSGKAEGRVFLRRPDPRDARELLQLGD